MSSSRPAEVTEIHTRLIRLALGVSESRGYWEHVDPRWSRQERIDRAFEQRWFGVKSPSRVRFLVDCMAARYDAFPKAFALLLQWRGMDPRSRQVLCHWHMQLSDPLYRDFTGGFLLERRSALRAEIDRDVVHRWLRGLHPSRWGAATSMQIARKLIAAAGEAGLCAPRGEARALSFPMVPDRALIYGLRLLQEVQISGTLLSNRYLHSVGLAGDVLGQRLRTLPGLTFRRLGHHDEIEWHGEGLLPSVEA